MQAHVIQDDEVAKSFGDMIDLDTSRDGSLVACSIQGHAPIVMKRFSFDHGFAIERHYALVGKEVRLREGAPTAFIFVIEDLDMQRQRIGKPSNWPGRRKPSRILPSPGICRESRRRAGSI